MTTMRQFVGEVLRARRLAAGLTLRDVSAKARVSLGYISEIERGHKEPSSELLAALTDGAGRPAVAGPARRQHTPGDRRGHRARFSVSSIAPDAPRVEVSAA